MVKGKDAIIHGMQTRSVLSRDGSIAEVYSLSAGLDYPGVGPEHAHLQDIGRASYVAVTDHQAVEALVLCSQKEGITPALETAHAVYHAIEMAKTMPKDKIILVNLSGRGDKDVETIQAYLKENPLL
jgi:tryptophan synthase beta subunit